MPGQPTAMHVVRIKSSRADRQGRERQDEPRLLRRTWREGGTVRNETPANLSKMPDRVVDAVGAALKGQVLVPAGQAAVSIARSLPHGHVAAVHAMARRPG
ncbi:MAG: IS1634 family transposase, partial [Gemmatimonadales bacterium]